MIAVDTNILVYAHRRDSVWHDAARACLQQLAEGTRPWAIPWPCLHEFFGVATHPRIFAPPGTASQAWAQIEAWTASPSLRFIGEDIGYLAVLATLTELGRIAGPQIHDARVAAICQLHGVNELWSADRDFSRFPEVAVKNPLVAA